MFTFNKNSLSANANSSIYLRLAGGLGNQLFQAAAAVLVTTRLRRPIVFSTSGLDSYQVRRESYLRSIIGDIPQMFFEGFPIPSCVNISLNNFRLGRLCPMISINDRNITRVLAGKVFAPLFMDGYFQDFWTWPLFEQALSQLNVPPVSSVGSRIQAGEVLVHIRGGDFLLNKNFFVADLAYYRRAVTESSALNLKRYALLSDDKKYAQYLISSLAACFPSLSFRIISESGVLEDFDLIRGTRYKIIGNSTFAWWASALSIKSSHTWSTILLTRGRPKKFLLPWETAI